MSTESCIDDDAPRSLYKCDGDLGMSMATAGLSALQPAARIAPRGLAGHSDSELATAYEPLDTAALPANCILLNVYNIRRPEADKPINRTCTANGTDFIGHDFHAGVVAFGSEWSYGFTEDVQTGVCQVVPRTHPQHTYCVTVNMGLTQLSLCRVESCLQGLMARWKGVDYSDEHQNCIDFCCVFCKALGVGRVPNWVDSCSRTSLDSPSRRVADGSRSAKQFAKLSSADSHPRVRSVGDNLAHEIEEVLDAGVAGAQALSVGCVLWGQGLLRAAARALGDADPNNPHGSPGQGDALRTSLRNRGGLRVPAKRPAPGAPKIAYAKDVTVDAFLLDDLPGVPPFPIYPNIAASGTGDFPSPAPVASNGTLPHRSFEPELAPASAEVTSGEGDVIDVAASWVALPPQQQLACGWSSDSDGTLSWQPTFSAPIVPGIDASVLGSTQPMSAVKAAPATDMAASWVALPSSVVEVEILQGPDLPFGPATTGLPAPAPAAVAASAVSSGLAVDEVARTAAAQAGVSTTCDGEDEWTML